MGTLVLVATPIGNLGDMSPRAADALRNASLICCEDTRRTGKLLSHLGISGVRMAITNEHTEFTRITEVLDLLADDKTVAVVTDAGTPGISDPGERLVRAAVEQGHVVTSVPGPTAAIMGLVISGMSTARFVFDGFLPRSGPERATRLAEVANERRTIVLYEAPHRLARTLADLRDTCGPDRHVVLARELTKLHENAWRGSLSDAAAFAIDVEPIGEYVIVVAGAPEPPAITDAEIERSVRELLTTGATRKAAITTVARDLGVPKNRVYDLALTIRLDD